MVDRSHLRRVCGLTVSGLLAMLPVPAHAARTDFFSEARTSSFWMTASAGQLGTGDSSGLCARLGRHPELGGILTDLLCKAGLSAEWVSVRKTPIGPDFFSDEDEQRQVVSALLAYPDAFVATPDGELIAEREGSMVDLFLVSLDVGLGRQPGQAVGFAVSELPETALRLLHVAPLLFSDPHAPSPCFVVDDLLRALPTNAAKEIVRSVQNRCPSQLVLTSESSRAEAADPSRPVGFSGQKLVYLKNEASVLKNAAS